MAEELDGPSVSALRRGWVIIYYLELTGANDCKCSRGQRLNVPSKARKFSLTLLFKKK
jgi:hypothetical protein